MSLADAEGVWTETVDSVALRREISQAADDRLLVRFTFVNDGDLPAAARVIEDLPAGVTGSTLVTAVGGDPSTWRHVGAWILHEIVVPPAAERTTAYLLDVDGEASLQAPHVHTVEAIPEHLDPAAVLDSNGLRDGGLETTGDSATVGTVAEGSPAGRTRSHRSEQSVGVPREGLIEELLAELDGPGAGEQKRRLQAHLGLAPSERARLEYLQSRFDELEAYVDALELLVDEHGVDAMNAMREDVEANRQRTETLQAELDELAAFRERFTSAVSEPSASDGPTNPSASDGPANPSASDGPANPSDNDGPANPSDSDG